MKIIACNVCKKPIEITDLFKIQLSSCNRTFDVGDDFDVCPNCIGVVKKTIESSLSTLSSVACSGKVTVTTVELPENVSSSESIKKPVKETGSISVGKRNYKKSVINEDDFNQINRMFINDNVEPKEISQKLKILLPVVRAVISIENWESYQKSFTNSKSDSSTVSEVKSNKAFAKKRVVSANMYDKVKDLQATNFSIDYASEYTRLHKSTVETIYASDNRREYLLTIIDINKVKELANKGWDNIKIAKEIGCVPEDISIVLFE